METDKKQFDGWETQAEIDICLDSNGLSVEQMIRHRRRGLLPAIVQVPHKYHGSTIHYPVGTCAQIAALARLLEVKKDLNYVGHHLWLAGYPVDDRYWRPQLIKSAHRFDRGISRIRQYLERDDERADQPTLQERMARKSEPNIILSRIRRRLSGSDLAAHYGVLLSVATGGFQQFDLPGPNEKVALDRTVTIEAMDIGASETDTALGHKLLFVNALPHTLRAMAKAFETGSLSKIGQGPTQSIFAARDDARNALRAGLAFYDATAWIYGPRAFGLRMVAWIARKKSDWIMDILILGMAMLRQNSNELLSTTEIASLADKAEQTRHDSHQMRELGKTDARFREVFSPKRVRQGMRDQPSYNIWFKEVELARLS